MNITSGDPRRKQKDKLCPHATLFGLTPSDVSDLFNGYANKNSSLS